MTKDDIIRMAWEAGIRVAGPMNTLSPNNVYTHELHRFADLVAAAEREECAKVCEEELCNCCWEDDAQDAAEHLAETIRARGEK